MAAASAVTTAAGGPTWCDHDLILLGSQSQEREVVERVNVTDGAARLHYQLVDQAGVVHRTGVVQR